MLIKCPECELQISDKAVACPHCGYPLKPNSRQRISTKRKKLPNGFGQISFLKGRNLRKPYRVMITVSKTDLGRPVCKILSYHKTYNEAYEALIAYHKDPYKVESNITMKELFEKWKNEYNGAHSYYLSLKSGWAYCSEIYNIQVKDIRARHIKACLENGIVIRDGKTITPSCHMQQMIKNILSALLDYAVIYDLVDHNYAKDIDVAKIAERSEPTTKKTHSAFNRDDLKLMQTTDSPLSKMITVQCYTGMRPQEICKIKRKDLNITDWYMIGGMKTKNGKNRIIPIHEDIREIILEFYEKSEGKEYLFPLTSYKGYWISFTKFMPNHLPHDPRKTFVTYAKKSKMDEYAIKRIVGHKISDVTEAVYTERGLDWLHEELQKIKLYV